MLFPFAPSERVFRRGTGPPGAARVVRPRPPGALGVQNA